MTQPAENENPDATQALPPATDGVAPFSVPPDMPDPRVGGFSGSPAQPPPGAFPNPAASPPPPHASAPLPLPAAPANPPVGMPPHPYAYGSYPHSGPLQVSYGGPPPPPATGPTAWPAPYPGGHPPRRGLGGGAYTAIAIGVLLVLILGGLATFLLLRKKDSDRSPRATVGAFINAVEADDRDKVAELTCDTYDEEVLESLTELVGRDNEIELEFEHTIIDETEVDADTRHVVVDMEVTMKRPDSDDRETSDEKVTFIVEREDDTWRICGTD